MSADEWRRGVTDSIAWVLYRLDVLTDLTAPAYRQALLDVLVHLEAMLERGTPSSVSPYD